MIRKALIIYCDRTASGRLTGPTIDNSNYIDFLTSQLGGDWDDDEIVSYRNPTIEEVKYFVNWNTLFADYTFTIFSGHGYISRSDNEQYLELSNGDLPLNDLINNVDRQTIIVDACRGYYSETEVLLEKAEKVFHFISVPSTREVFDRAVMRCRAGKVVLYAASENESALDTNDGGAYLTSLIASARNWKRSDTNAKILPLNVVHSRAKIYLQNNFETNQEPTYETSSNYCFFPFAVKH